jgi:hypothetical protein
VTSSFGGGVCTGRDLGAQEIAALVTSIGPCPSTKGARVQPRELWTARWALHPEVVGVSRRAIESPPLGQRIIGRGATNGPGTDGALKRGRGCRSRHEEG